MNGWSQVFKLRKTKGRDRDESPHLNPAPFIQNNSHPYPI